MIWVLMAVGAIILFWFLRRLGREQSAVLYPSDPAQPIAAPAAEPTFALRSPMSFDDFYNQYYATDNIDRSFVRQVLEFVSKSGGVPVEQLRPEDRLEQLPKQAVSRWVQFLKKMLDAGMRKRGAELGVAPVELHLDTIDDLIRQLEPHHLEAFKMHGPIGNS